ncbi:MAG: tetratricopeptide repeat protein [Gammaproteobacteria bacterium]|nr:tetratricopeptide repeat protein [Gammaproteobacteria bacterium]
MHFLPVPSPYLSGHKNSNQQYINTTRSIRVLLTLSIIALITLLSSCAQQAQTPTKLKLPTDTHSEAKNRGQNETKPQKASITSPRSFSADTLYTLLVAEVAGNREHYHLALANYYNQAVRTKDAGVAARTTHIARYLNARPVALSSAKLWVELEPSNLEAQLAATVELTLAGDVKDALAHAESVLALGGDAPLQPLAITATSQSELTLQLIPKFRRLTEQYPHNSEVALGLAILLKSSKNYQEALSITRRVQRQQPKLFDAPLLLSHLLIDLERRDEARTLLEDLLKIHPQASRLRLQYARLLIREDLTLARQQFAELVKQRPQDGNMILSLALIQLETGHIDEAQPLFERLLELEQHESAANYALGRINEQRGNIPLAVDHYRRVDTDGEYMTAITRGTGLLLASGDPQTANSWFNELRQRHNNKAKQFYLLEAKLLHKFAFHREARILLSQALEEYSNNQQLIYAHAMASEQLGEYSEFEAGLRKLLLHEPNNASLLNTLGYNLLADDSRLEEARQLIGRALELSPEDPAIIDSMGWAQYRLGNHQEAVKLLRKAMQQLPNHEIAAHLGEALWAQGNRKQALAVWKQGLKLNPESKIIPETMQRLKGEQNLDQQISER